MFHVRSLWLSGGCLAAALGSTAFQQPTFRQGVELVRVYATVRSNEGRLIAGVGADQFEISVDGKPVPVAAFSTEARELTLVLMIDVSGSMKDRLLWSRDAGLALVEALQPGDRLRIGSFGEEVQLSPSLTNDRATLRRTLMEELWPGGGTPLWEAVSTSFKSLEGESGRRAVVTISDGVGSATPSESELSATIMADTLASRVIMYAIGTKAKGLGAFKEIAQRSGGGHVALNDIVDVRALMREVISELRFEYIIGFVPPVLDGRNHALSVRVRLPAATAVAPRRFIAPVGRQ